MNNELGISLELLRKKSIFFIFLKAHWGLYKRWHVLQYHDLFRYNNITPENELKIQISQIVKVLVYFKPIQVILRVLKTSHVHTILMLESGFSNIQQVLQLKENGISTYIVPYLRSSNIYCMYMHIYLCMYMHTHKSKKLSLKYQNG